MEEDTASPINIEVACDNRITWYKFKCLLDIYLSGYMKYHAIEPRCSLHKIQNFYTEHIGTGETRYAIWNMLRTLGNGSYRRKALGPHWTFLDVKKEKQILTLPWRAIIPPHLYEGLSEEEMQLAREEVTPPETPMPPAMAEIQGLAMGITPDVAMNIASIPSGSTQCITEAQSRQQEQGRPQEQPQSQLDLQSQLQPQPTQESLSTLSLTESLGASPTAAAATITTTAPNALTPFNSVTPECSATALALALEGADANSEPKPRKPFVTKPNNWGRFPEAKPNWKKLSHYQLAAKMTQEELLICAAVQNKKARLIDEAQAKAETEAAKDVNGFSQSLDSKGRFWLSHKTLHRLRGKAGKLAVKKHRKKLRAERRLLRAKNRAKAAAASTATSTSATAAVVAGNDGSATAADAADDASSGSSSEGD